MGEMQEKYIEKMIVKLVESSSLLPFTNKMLSIFKSNLSSTRYKDIYIIGIN